MVVRAVRLVTLGYHFECGHRSHRIGVDACFAHRGCLVRRLVVMVLMPLTRSGRVGMACGRLVRTVVLAIMRGAMRQRCRGSGQAPEEPQ